jgi:aldehyde dehydrogenase (NAD+)
MEPESTPTNLLNLPSSSKLYKDPLGVVLIIAPWNYPFQLMINPLIGAIAAGNCVVLKPSEFAPATSRLISKMISEIFDPQYVKVVEGDGAEVIPVMMDGFRFDHVFYTGSIPVGRSIYKMAADKLIPVTLELGGKSPTIVDETANIAVAAKRIAFGKFINAGQTCIAPDYILVHTKIKEKFIEKLKEAITAFYSQDPASSDEYGKIINHKRFDKLVSYLDDCVVLHGGKHDRENLFISPTIIENVSADAEIMHEEIFGPVLPVISYSNREEAVRIIERNESPLAFYLFTSSAKEEKFWMENVSFGGGCINNADWHFTNHHLPFGGIGYSGIGAYHGIHSFNTFTHAKPVMKTPTWLDPSIKYPPFKGKLKLFKKFM